MKPPGHEGRNDGIPGKREFCSFLKKRTKRLLISALVVHEGLSCCVTAGWQPPGDKSLSASFSSENEDSCFFKQDWHPPPPEG
jgi:hypothetical protein